MASDPAGSTFIAQESHSDDNKSHPRTPRLHIAIAVRHLLTGWRSSLRKEWKVEDDAKKPSPASWRIGPGPDNQNKNAASTAIRPDGWTGCAARMESERSPQ